MDFEEGIKAAAWPTHDPQLFYDIAAVHRERAAALHEAADTSAATSRYQFGRALRGQAGDALIEAHDENVARWRRHADQHHQPAAQAATNVGDHIAQLRRQLGLLIDEGKPRYDEALQQGHHAAAVQIFAGYRAEATGLAGQRAEQIAAELANNPLAPAPDDGGGKGDKGKSSGADKHKPADDTETTPTTTAPASTATGNGGSGTTESTPVGAGPNGGSATVPGVKADTSETTPNSPGAVGGMPYRPAAPPMPASPLGGSAGGGGLSSGLSGLGSSSGLGSGLQQPMSALSALTSPASLPQAPPTPAAGLGNLGGSFNSGLAAGAAASGAGSGVASPTAMAAPLAPQHSSHAVFIPAVRARVPIQHLQGVHRVRGLSCWRSQQPSHARTP